MTANKKKALVTIVGVAAVLTLVIGGTLAYLQDKTPVVTNNFQKNKVEISLTETGNGQFSIVPGTSVKKDPKVSGTATLPSWVLLKVDDTTNGLVTYSIDSGWTKLEGYEGVYYRSAGETSTNSSFTYDVLANNQVTYAASITNETMDYGNGNATLAFTSYVVQKAKSGMDSTVTDFTPREAWLLVSQGIVANTFVNIPANGTSTENGEAILSAVNSASSNGSVAVDLKEGTYEVPLGISGKNVTLIGEGVDKTVLDFDKYDMHVDLKKSWFADCGLLGAPVPR